MPEEKLRLSGFILFKEKQNKETGKRNSAFIMVFEKGNGQATFALKLFSKMQVKEKLLELKHLLNAKAFQKILTQILASSNDEFPMDSECEPKKTDEASARNWFKIIECSGTQT
jgi:hypothetical protein